MADFGYDVCDYCDIHPLFGTLAPATESVGGAVVPFRLYRSPPSRGKNRPVRAA